MVCRVTFGQEQDFVLWIIVEVFYEPFRPVVIWAKVWTEVLLAPQHMSAAIRHDEAGGGKFKMSRIPIKARFDPQVDQPTQQADQDEQYRYLDLCCAGVLVYGFNHELADAQLLRSENVAAVNHLS